MSYTAHDPRLFRAAVIAQLATSTGKNIGDGAAPTDTTYPYAFVVSAGEDIDPERLGTVTDAHLMTFFDVQVTSVGSTQDQAEWMQQKVRVALAGWQPSVAGVTCGLMEIDTSLPALRDDDVQPPNFFTVDIFTCSAA
jgi:hypothetical protein